MERADARHSFLQQLLEQLNQLADMQPATVTFAHFKVRKQRNSAPTMLKASRWRSRGCFAGGLFIGAAVLSLLFSDTRSEHVLLSEQPQRTHYRSNHC